MENPSDNYLDQVVKAFLYDSTTFFDHSSVDFYQPAKERLTPFLMRFWPVLRHYRPEVVGQCLAISFDTPAEGRRLDRGFGLHMAAGDHPQDRESQLGSYRDDGAYLGLLARDFFIGALQ